MDGLRVRFYPRSSSPNQIVSDHPQRHPHSGPSSLQESFLRQQDESEGDQSSECSSNLTADSNNRSRSFNFVRKFRERRRSNTINSDSGLFTKSKRSVSPPIETGIEVVDDSSIMDLHMTPEEAVPHETAGRFTVTNAGVVTNATQNLNTDERFLVTTSPNRNSVSFSSVGHDHSESCSISLHSNASSLLNDERKMVDEETSTPDAPTVATSPASFDPPLVPKEAGDQEPEVGSIGEQILHAVPLVHLGDNKHVNYVVQFGRDLIERYRRIPLKKYRFCAFVLLFAVTYVSPGFITGILWGLYAATILFLYVCVSDPIQPQEMDSNEYSELLEKVKEECIREEHPAQAKIYRGWMNLYDEHYNPHTFHVNSVQTVLVRLDGKMLRISRPDKVMLKHGFHTDPTLIENEPRMIAQNIYDLTNATIRLRPRRLARRRWFSRKYPICIKLSAASNEILSSNREYATITDVPEVQGSEEVEDEENDSQNDQPNAAMMGGRSTVVEVGREADGYLSDTEDSDDERLFVPRSASDVHLNSTTNSGGILSRFRKSNTAQKSFRSSRKIYLFARCAREKERWFHRLRRACYKFSVPKDLYPEASSRRLSLPSSGNPLGNDLSRDYFLYILHALQFSKHLNEILEAETSSSAEQNGVVFMDLGRTKWNEPTETSGKELVRVANLLVSRVFYDFCRDKYWCAAVQNKIQNKLATIHLPYFIETLELSGFNIGTAIPMIEKIYEPVIDEWGIWVDFEIKYDGLIKLALETRVNLMRIKEQHDSTDCSSNLLPTSIANFRPLSRYSDEEIPESPETSPDEDYGSKMKLHDNAREKKKGGKKVLHLIDKIASSNFFKEASELRPIRKLMEEVSSTRLMLNVEVTKLEGTMTVNLAPPPSDRLWYSFRRAPQMSIHAVPQIGDRTVVFSTLSDWIEKKMVQLLEKNLVVPNMDDVIIPIMSGNDLLQGPINK